MEIYTGDLITIAQQYAQRINEGLNIEGNYLVEDECCNLEHDIRKILYGRFSIAFNQIMDEQDWMVSYRKEDIRNKLHKLLNEF